MNGFFTQPGSSKPVSSIHCPSIKLLLKAVERDLGGFSVRRFLPSKELANIGPFIFFDHIGPAIFPPGEGIDVRPHPHIGLATVTYVFSGEILHRDSLGHVQSIRPNEINWMTAGKGIVHSERTPPELRQHGHTLEGLQLWVALPEEQQESDPLFTHYEKGSLPQLESDKVKIRVLIGEAYGLKSEVKTHSSTLFVEVQLDTGGQIMLPEGIEDRAVYVISGQLQTQEAQIPQHRMAVFDQTAGIQLEATEPTRLAIIGGTNLGKRTVWWNLVSSRKDLIEQAKRDWREQKFPEVPGETEFIPLPE
ncbi:MAG: pirin family protein [Desulfuromusa sp.]|jgi:redox-sensitive bicupin YhaK (pirin superfamily)|nr:pirin family protein [Desulfuromusa sp.]